MEIAASEFLRAHPGSWIAGRAPQYPVINVHAVDVAAPPERIFAALAAPQSVAMKWRWRVLFGVRFALGKIFAWDAGLRHHGLEPLVPGNHWAFFRIEQVASPRPVGAAPGLGKSGACELGLSVENKLTLALMSYVVEPAAQGARLFNVTCAAFKGRVGRAYWRVIRPFHDAIIEDSLEALRRKAEESL